LQWKFPFAKKKNHTIVLLSNQITGMIRLAIFLQCATPLTATPRPLNVFHCTETFLLVRMMSPGMRIVGRTRKANFWHSRKEVILLYLSVTFCPLDVISDALLLQILES